MKRLFKNDGTLLFGYWIHTHWKDVPASYLRWASENVPGFDLQLERLRQGLEPIPGLHDGTKALPVAKPPIRKTFVSKSVRPMNHTPPTSHLVIHEPLAKAIEEGLTRKQIADRFGLSAKSIDKRIKRLGLPKPTDGRKFNDPGAALRMRAAEARAKKAAERHEADAHNACILKIRNGRICWTTEAYATIAKLMNQFKCWDEVAKAVGFKPGGKVLCQRYYAHRNLPRYVAGRSRKMDDCASRVDKTLDPKQPRMPKRRNLLRRIWDAFFNPL